MTESENCPICKRRLPMSEEGGRLKPFCSKRCADVDLGRWLTGSYAIPAVESDDESDSEPGATDEGMGVGPARH